MFNYDLAAIVAFMKVAKTLVFSKDSILNARENILAQYKYLEESIFKRSIALGDTIGGVILQRASS